MMFRRSVPRLLHDEHVATLAVLDRVEGILLRGRNTPPDPSDAQATRAIGQWLGALQTEVSGHFDFEEIRLFPLLREQGEGDLADLLHEEHVVMREAAAEIQEIAKATAANGYSNDSWAAFRRLTGELSERLRSHIEKEEMSLVPSLEDMLDADLDAEIAATHGEY